MENEKKLTRSSNRMIAGVCSGIAEYFGWDPTLLRIVYVLATFFTAFAGVIIYIILWIVMPYKTPSDGYENRIEPDMSKVETSTYVWAVGLVDRSNKDLIGLDIAAKGDILDSGWLKLSKVSIKK